MKNKDMKEFNYELARAGHPVQTRDGRKVRIICWDAENRAGNIIALVYDNYNNEVTCSYHNDGKYFEGSRKTQFDLVMSPETHEGWVNLFRREDGTISVGDCYVSKECAKEEIAPQKTLNFLGLTYITTTKIEWEE